MTVYTRERRALQAAVAITALLPVVVGTFGVLCGLSVFDDHPAVSSDADSHVRYLSGLILAIGLGFWSTVSAIERQGNRFRLLTFLVLVGGCARIATLAQIGPPTKTMALALIMELVVTPALALWRERLDRKQPVSTPQRH